MSRRNRPWPPGVPCWADFSVPDVAAALPFYRELLGWVVEPGPPELGYYASATRDGGAAAGIGSVPPGGTAGSMVYLATDDAHATAQAVTKAGGTLVVEPMQMTGIGTMMVFTDPVGAATGAWQHGPFIGAETINQPGALVWEDLRSPDPDASRAFLTDVFGLSFDPLPGMEGTGYTTMSLGEGFPLGGVGPLFGASRPGWVAYFGVDDIDASVAVARANGARSVDDVQDTPFGRMASVTDPFGVTFTLSQNTGQPQPDRS